MLCVDDIAPGQFVAFYGFDCSLGFIPHGDTDNFEALVGILLVEVFDYGSLTYAGTTPACPEVDEYIFAFSHHVGETEGGVVVGHLEVFEHFAHRGLFFELKSLAHLFEACIAVEDGIYSCQAVDFS